METLSIPWPPGTTLGRNRIVCGWGDKRDRCKRQHGSLRACARRIEVLLFVTQAASEHRGAQHQQDVAHDRPCDRGLHDVMQPGAQRCERDDQLGGVAEGGVEQPTNTLARPIGQLLGRAAHPASKREYCDRSRGEDQQMAFWSKVLERDRDGNEHEQPVQHRYSLLWTPSPGELQGAPAAAPLGWLGSQGYRRKCRAEMSLPRQAARSRMIRPSIVPCACGRRCR